VLISREQGRVIGSLIEKQLTTPQQYPLTLNALLAACNQSSNRDPVVCYDEAILREALAELKSIGLARFVHPSHGRSVIRYRQVLEERMALSEEQLALVGLLLLRGPQTAAELRGRSERMAQFDGIASVETELESMSAREQPLVRRVPRRPGQKEERWAQVLTSESGGELHPGGTADAIGADGQARPAGAADRAASGTPGGTAGLGGSIGGQPPSLGDLCEQVAALRAEVAELRTALEDLHHQLGA
jgi:uncharacterized protein YceH (UPF0502 family)